MKESIWSLGQKIGQQGRELKRSVEEYEGRSLEDEYTELVQEQEQRWGEKVCR